MNTGRTKPAATGNSSFGYFGGGITPITSTVDRIDYSNDTATASSKGPLSATKYELAASSSRANAIPTENIVNYAQGTYATPHFGYFTGGLPGPLSSVDRVDYSNDTATVSPKGPLSAIKYAHAATGNSDFGYFGGGFSGSSKSSVDRIDYSNDIATAVAKGPLSSARHHLGATGNSDFGYFGGGAPLHQTTVDRIDYSNDTATAVAKGPLSVSRLKLAATGNSDFGYFGGGHQIYGNTEQSTVDRIDYSNDTATASPKGPLRS